MTGQEAALASLARILDASGVPYMVIGGHANALWGEPRATLDIDVTIWLPEAAVPALVADLAPEFRPRVADPETFVCETRVLPVATGDGLAVDLIFGLLPFEEQAIARARAVELGAQEVRFCTAEDLILLKIVSTRERDLEDVQGVVRAQGKRLDREYLEPRVRELAELLERPEILEFWRQLAP
jgi:predicted nucleotidyltransferase